VVPHRGVHDGAEDHDRDPSRLRASSARRPR
jgi:hypothetical protein